MLIDEAVPYLAIDTCTKSLQLRGTETAHHALWKAHIPYHPIENNVEAVEAKIGIWFSDGDYQSDFVDVGPAVANRCFCNDRVKRKQNIVPAFL